VAVRPTCLSSKWHPWQWWASGLESEVQCIPQQMHELRPFPVPDNHKLLRTSFLLGVMWAPVGRGAAPCHCHWHQGPAMGELAGWSRVSQLKFRGKATEPAQSPLIQIMIDMCNNAKGGSFVSVRLSGNPSSCSGPCHRSVLEKCKHHQTCNHASKQAAHQRNFHTALKRSILCVHWWHAGVL
jgi:hypothetical protein